MDIKCSDTSNKKIKELKKMVEELFRKEIDELLTFQNDNNIKLVLPFNDINIIIGTDWS